MDTQYSTLIFLPKKLVNFILLVKELLSIFIWWERGLKKGSILFCVYTYVEIHFFERNVFFRRCFAMPDLELS